MSDALQEHDSPTVTPMAHAVGWSRVRRAAVALSVLVLAAWLTDRGLVRWIGWTAEIAGQVDNTVADLRLRVVDPPQRELEGAQSRLVMAWDASDPLCTQQLMATLRWQAGLSGSSAGEVGILILPTAEDTEGNPLATALAAVHVQEKLLPWLENWPGDRPVTVAALRALAAADEREAAIFARQLDNTELQLAARTWARMAQGLELGKCGARMDGWELPPDASLPREQALAKELTHLAHLRGGSTLDPALSQEAAVRAAGLSAATAGRWQRWIIGHQKVGNRQNGQDNGQLPGH